MKSNPNIGLIIPTRYHSERLPGKVLIDINGKSNLERIIERANQSKYIKKIILAVSEGDCAEILNWYSTIHNEDRNTKVNMYSGNHNNIFQRTLNAAHTFNIDIIVDISHCCSLFDPFLADRLIEDLMYYKADYSANCITRSFPDGFDIQVYTTEVYGETYMHGLYWKPYWTGWNIWHCRENLNPKPRIINMQAKPEHYFPEWRLTLDTLEDLKVITEIYKHFEGIHFH
ncbi:MAG: hypothetical protein M0P71_17235, partial [Melioribacteraceae bacterium]|nr:hypothetical protein [Melioribacteraceae bacterium]